MSATPEQNLQHLLRTSFAAWGSVVDAWTKAVTSIYGAIAEWAVEEDERLRFGETECWVRVATDTDLVAELSPVSDATMFLMPGVDVEVTPSHIPAMAADAPAVRVRVRITSVGRSGPYVGQLVDQAGVVVEPDIYVSLG